jgi:hypothetical protein
MQLLGRRCSQPNCSAPSSNTRCQGCGKSFCSQHVKAVEFSGVRAPDETRTEWVRYVCDECAKRENAQVLSAMFRRSADHDFDAARANA